MTEFRRSGSVPWHHSIAARLLLALAGLLCLGLVWSGTVTYLQMAHQTEREELHHLVDIRGFKSASMLAYIAEHLRDAGALAGRRLVSQALMQFTAVAAQKGIGSPEYRRLETGYHEPFDAYLHTWHYHDLFLIDRQGRIVFTVGQDGEAGTNLLTGPYRDSRFAHLFRRSMALLEVDNCSFEFYPPSRRVVAFIMAPVIAEGRVLGAVALQFVPDAFGKATNGLAGLGGTGEVVFGTQVKGETVVTMPLRHDPGAAFKRRIAFSPFNSMLDEASAGQNGMGIVNDWRGKRVLASWTYLPDLKWGIVVKIDESEAMAPLHRMRRNVMLVVVASMLVAVAISIFLSRSLTGRLRQLSDLGLRFAQGDYEGRADMREQGRDEIGQLAASFNLMADEIESSHQELGSMVDELEQLNAVLDQRIRERTANLQAVIDYAVDGILTVNEEGNVESLNPAAEAIFDCRAGEVIGSAVESLIPSWRALKEGDVAAGAAHMEVNGVRSDGVPFPMELSISHMVVEGQRLQLLAVRDLTEWKAREREVALLAKAVEHARDIVMITDREGIIQYVNPAFEKITGYSSSEAIGQRPSLVHSGEQTEEFYRQMWQTIGAGNMWSATFVNRNRAGELYEVDQVITPILDDHHEVSGFVSVQRDVTEQRKVQKRMEHAQRLESLGVLAGGIAHDFNNILTSIMGNAALAKLKVGQGFACSDYLGRIENASRRAADLCQQMLAYSGKGRFVVKSLNLSDLVREITNLLEVSIAKNVVLNFDLADPLPAVDADAAQMQQVIMNLVINASEAIGKQSGVISVRTGVTEVSDKYLAEVTSDAPLPEGRYVYIEVADTGCGMDQETKAKLFDPFFTTKFTGRGLGMSAVLGIVRGHHGGIKVYSEEGKGSNFKVLFPCSETLSEPGPRDAATAEGWKGSGTILIVDDEETIRETAAMMLAEYGFDSLRAGDGVEGVEVYREHMDEIVAVLLDMTMPRMDGEACFGQLRRINPDVKVILSSGYNEQDATKHFAGQGLAGFIQKPYTPEQLGAKLKGLLEKA